MTTLVTGAAGFLGGHVAELMLAEGEPTAVLLRPGEDLGPLTVRARARVLDACPA